jgi:murein DD-endopeptidase MepM/ murein hydrolase activator NlpD
VEYGTVLGQAGASGAGEGSAVHFEVRKSTEALDPLQWLAPGGGQ